MKITNFANSLFQESCYIIWDESLKESYVIDPGMMSEEERNVVDQFISNHNLTVKSILLTHAHIDHAVSAAYMAKKYNCAICANKDDDYLAEILPMQAQLFRLMLNIRVEPLKIDIHLNDGDQLQLGEINIQISALPGHSKGGLMFYIPECKAAFVGDSVFQGSIGRTDLWGGDYDALMDSIHHKIYPLPDDTTLYPGHGDATTVGNEKRYNPYFK